METPRPNRELDVDDDILADDEGCVLSSFVFIERFNGASSDVDVLGLPINELTSNANGLPLTVWLLAFVPLLIVLLLMLLVVVTVTELLVVVGRRSSWAVAESAECRSAVFLPDRFLSSLAGDDELGWADWTDWTAAAMAGGMPREASGLPKKGYDMAMEERDDKLELGVVVDAAEV